MGSVITDSTPTRTRREREAGRPNFFSQGSLGPPCRQQSNTRPCADPAPGYELWVSSKSLARAIFLKLVASFAHSARRDECNFEETNRSIDVSGALQCLLGLYPLDRSLSDPVIVVLGVFPEMALATSPHALSAGLRVGPAHISSYTL